MKKTVFILFTLGLLSAPVCAQKPFPFTQYHKVLFIGAHPDDNESAAGGTMIRLQQNGTEVVSVYLTSGEAGIEGKSFDEAAAIRRAELKEACQVMGVGYRWLSQIDGHTEITPSRYVEMLELIQQEKPDAVFTHWPIDGHRDHRICSILVFDAWIQMHRQFDLYYYEVETGHQSRNFNPECYVNIDSVYQLKYKALFCHQSQNPQRIMDDWHNDMELYRGKESECTRAEAFILQKGTR